jgi:alpha-amylase
VRDTVIYTIVHQPCRLRLPARPTRPDGIPKKEIAAYLFDEALNERYFRRVAERRYYPTTERFVVAFQVAQTLFWWYTFQTLL